ncbi:AAA family ATPase [Rhodococcus sp. ACS1]|uniref:AAA family ATPase n=1 Tax=Rhodococcus sp. ACS1 TaxID=2028570 RepID=UPI00117B7F1E|nr:AAA family ATPase [Rhodococcus sp. ACS1]
MVSTVDPWPLVGRKEERHLINATITGTGGFGGIAIAGAAGVGKSRLAREAITHVRPGRWIPRWARATTSARALPLGTFTEWAGGVATEPVVGHLHRTSLKPASPAATTSAPSSPAISPLPIGVTNWSSRLRHPTMRGERTLKP